MKKLCIFCILTVVINSANAENHKQSTEVKKQISNFKKNEKRYKEIVHDNNAPSQKDYSLKLKKERAKFIPLLSIMSRKQKEPFKMIVSLLDGKRKGMNLIKFLEKVNGLTLDDCINSLLEDYYPAVNRKIKKKTIKESYERGIILEVNSDCAMLDCSFSFCAPIEELVGKVVTPGSMMTIIKGDHFPGKFGNIKIHETN